MESPGNAPPAPAEGPALDRAALDKRYTITIDGSAHSHEFEYELPGD